MRASSSSTAMRAEGALTRGARRRPQARPRRAAAGARGSRRPRPPVPRRAPRRLRSSPPCACTMRATIASPRPVPRGLVVKKGSKICSAPASAHAGSGVGHLEQQVAVLRVRAQRDAAAFARGLGGVHHQVEHQLRQQIGIGFERGRLREALLRHLDATLLDLGLRQLQCVERDLLERDALHPQRPRAARTRAASR